ncbi:unnamed protein product [Linum tenue]|uniref:Uncharacterized protein n=1 Tax=Linum tenue TaxID=586396 RepID=A0AAV0S5C6_9ROSI|nr:unnamed protein product [Linum tenue]
MVWELSQRTGQNGSDHNKDRDIATAIEECYDKYFKESTQELSSADFYAAVCKTVEEINKKLNSTQFRVSDKEKLKQVYNSHYKDDSKNNKEKGIVKGGIPKGAGGNNDWGRVHGVRIFRSVHQNKG